MRIIIVIFAIFNMLSLASCTQQTKEQPPSKFISKEIVQEEEVPFIHLGRGEDIYVTTIDYNYILADYQPIALVKSQKDSLQLLLSDQGLKPQIYYKLVEIKQQLSLSLTRTVLIIRTPNLKTQYLGYSELIDSYIVSVAQDSIRESQILEIIKKHDNHYWARDFVPGESNNDSLYRAKTMQKICKDTHRTINKYAPVKCIAFNPYSGAMIVKHQTEAFLPIWKWEAANWYIRQKTSGSYNINTLQDADEAVRQKFRADFLEQLDKLTQ